MHNSLVPATHLTVAEDVTLHPDRAVTLLNPLSSELDTMRQSLLMQGLETLARNRNHQRPDLALFEFGKVYRQDGDGGHEEEERLALLVTGRTRPESWQGEGTDGLSFLKGAVDALLTRCGLQGAKRTALAGGGLFREGLGLSAKGGFSARSDRSIRPWPAPSTSKKTCFCGPAHDGRSAGCPTRITSADLPVPVGAARPEPGGSRRGHLRPDGIRRGRGKLPKEVNLFDVYTDEPPAPFLRLVAHPPGSDKTLNEKATTKLSTAFANSFRSSSVSPCADWPAESLP